MKTPKKSKPKQRTNWKQRALHCEEVINIQNQVANANQFYWGTAKQYVVSRDGTEYWPRAEMNRKIEEYLQRAEAAEIQTDLEVKLRDEYWNRALTAEKHNALLLEERDRTTAEIGRILKLMREELPTTKRSSLRNSLACLALDQMGIPDPLPEPEYCLCGEIAPKCICVKKFRPTHWQRFKSFLGSFSRKGFATSGD